MKVIREVLPVPVIGVQHDACRAFIGNRYVDDAHFQIGCRSIAGAGGTKGLGASVAVLLQGGPEAIKETKKFLRQLLALPDQDKWPLCTQVNAEMRGSAEAAEGLLAFVKKRPPQWVKQSSPAETGAR